MGDHGTGQVNILEFREKKGVDWTPWRYIVKSPNRHYTDSKKIPGEDNYLDLKALALDIIKIHDDGEMIKIVSRLNTYEPELVINKSGEELQTKGLDGDKLATIGDLISNARKKKLEVVANLTI